MTKQEELVQLLVRQDLVPATELNQAAADAQTEGRRIDELLLKRRLLDPEKLAQVKAQLYNLPYEDLTDKVLSDEVLNVFSSEVADNYRIICFGLENTTIKVGITDPENFKAIEAVDFLAKGSGLTAHFHLISEASFKAAFKFYKTLSKELDSAIQTKEEEVAAAELKKQEADGLEDVTKSAPVAKIVSVIIRHAVEGGASDIHIEPLMKETRVRYRIDGVLHTSLVLPKSIHSSLVARIKVMANLKLDETRMPQDGRLRLEIGEKVIDFRVSILPVVGNEKVVMRILDTTRGAPKLTDLGYQGQQLKVIENATTNTEGIILITGPTGSGKSTTIFSVLDTVNREGVNIATLEDPVEYQMKGVNQSQIKPEIGYTFASGLRAFLRQDPDIIMVGEIRDEETAELAIHAALTGHLVLSTLHTMDATGAITRLVDMGIEPFLLGSTLTAIVAQRLVRRVCRNCIEDALLPEEQLKEVMAEMGTIGIDYLKELIPDLDHKQPQFKKGKGCSRCGNTGYSGRLAISEALEANDKIKEMILSGKRHLTLAEVRQSQRYVTVKQDGVIKVLQGMTTMAEVYRVMKA